MIKITFLKDYHLYSSKRVVRDVIRVITLIQLALIIAELVFDLKSSTLALLLPIFILNSGLLIATYYRINRTLISTIQILLIFAIQELHFFTNPSSFHTVVYWSVFLPSAALLLQGIRMSLIWFAILIVIIVANGLYAVDILGAQYTKEIFIVPFIVGGVVFAFSVFFTLFALYISLGKSVDQLEARNSQIQALNTELGALNQVLESRIKDHTDKIKNQSELINRLAHYNNHLTEAPLANIKHIVGTIRTLGSAEYMIDMLESETQRLDEVLQTTRALQAKK